MQLTGLLFSLISNTAHWPELLVFKIQYLHTTCYYFEQNTTE